MVVRRLSWLLVLMPALAAGAELSTVKRVYFLSMQSGFDQYLANRVQKMGVWEVVADPAAADAVFTDALGPAFEQSMAALYPAPTPTPTPKPKKKDEEAEEEAPVTKEEPQVRFSSFRRGKGMVFVVDRQSKKVLFSVYAPPKSATPGHLDDAAEKVTSELKKSLAPPKK